MRLTISDIDSAPPDLEAQAPFTVELLRELPGPDRPDYWLGRLRRPLKWNRDGETVEVTHLVLGARWQGTRIGRDRKLPVGIAYVTDPTLLQDTHVVFDKCRYVAIGMARQAGLTLNWRVVLTVVISLLVLWAMQVMGW
jgi:hypothetical protein